MREFLSAKKVPFVEYDVSTNQAAATDMVQKSGQVGVPVTVVDGEVIIGFDRGKLERVLASQKPALGIRVASAAAKGLRAGALVGEVYGGSFGERAGLQRGDIIIEAEGQKIWGPADLEKTVSYLGKGKPITFIVMRGNERHELKAML